MACARTVGVVVPSPATSLVLEATSRTIWAPMFSRPSSSSISFATVTPSLVIVGEPNLFSMTTLRPLGPRVTFTAFARRLTPRRIACRDSSPCTTCFAIILFSCTSNFISSRVDTPYRRGVCVCHHSQAWNAIAKARNQHLNLLLCSRGLFLGRPGNDSEDFLLFHDEEVLSVNLDL